ncbi:DNA polymerase I A, chloroplastic/mitochondrial [Gracilariopsis chorda]|uniref:DNA polymerase I A, chloroplastic/mitochondrial n=1 Tax=Gracilariopsis chorda TaxID=448386 RepID=A0A2V3IJV1_9FLOR|nr:DNA polymerase I A, chloroplastic/mitochondrial [Gracilariopsis chorda]|eukprot:PXF42329.1 DNA polymerase I A, chloroplastic/mitochondrial [Gracilariopsis chorda]
MPLLAPRLHRAVRRAACRRLFAHAAGALSPAPHPDNVTVVQDVRAATSVVAALFELPPDTVVAWDTETHAVDPSRQSPVGNGRVICATAYAGHHVDFGTGARLFVDCLQPGVLQVLRPYFESRATQKVWHNYSFDRHVLANHGIALRGFAGDTMHMARLADSSLRKYSLQELCKQFLHDGLRKTPMHERFSALLGKKAALHTLAIHNNPALRHEWIQYASMDAELTHRLCHRLRTELQTMRIHGCNSTTQITARYQTLYDLYVALLVPFGELLTDMERLGFKVDTEWLKTAAVHARADQLRLEDHFRAWAQTHSPDAKYMNLHSDLQKQHLFFAPCNNKLQPSLSLPRRKCFNLVLTGELKNRYLAELQSSQSEEHNKLYQMYTGPNPKKVKRDVVLEGLGKKPHEYTAKGWPSVSAKAMNKLANKSAKKQNQSDREMSCAIDHLIGATAISSLMSSFIVPLQQWPGGDGRIHASLNLNTETGRLSSRRPNLQNQPALEKDRYRIRKAFVPEAGKSLIVADYGQLELRLLAHITECKSMIEAFHAGGDFHSRTALTMFDDVKRAVEQKKCILEREERSDPASSLPLLKDMFPVERRKAKTLNFSIAYGKTIVGLARDWNTSEEEAAETLNLWYKERQEVRQWQRQCKRFLRDHQFVETITGRRRHLPDIASDRMHERYHAQRAAINAPLQGSAADLVMGAMLKLHQDRVLRALGWNIILQVHDEIILEGPEESADIALPIVVEKMKNPLDIELRVDLTVDAKCAQSWYDAK